MGRERAKYSVGEYECRFLLDAVPDEAADPRRIVDRYIERSRLRLRTVHHGDGRVDHKLGHKRRPAADDPTAILHTSLFLDADEFAVLSSLPARELRKTRWTIGVGDDPGIGSVDVFEGPLTGLILVEFDLGHPELLGRFDPPPWVGPEVTRDETFTGGRLAGTQLADLATALATARSR